ncbi:MAG: MBL fold metallo-hydrolase [Desulfobacterales bacterium]|nr:MAG: MBL fold metallo-hydrolase [Desulfobacterales bacterium]
MDVKIQNVSDDLFLITLNPPINGFTSFISAWLYQNDVTCLVDVGPSSTAQGLLQALAELNVHRLDFILLTHIHLDHAGAIGDIAHAFLQTPIVCHPAGIPHLVDPSRLWEGTKKVLGATAEGYGPIQAVSQNRLVDAQQFTSEAIVPIITPGHALHHVSYWTDNYLFAGEAAGVYYPISRGRFYMRPATPPRFFFDIALESVDKLIASKPKKLCYGHYGMADDAAKMLENHRRQLFKWKTIIEDEIKRSHTGDLIGACVKRLFKEDSLLENFHNLSEDFKERETYFLRNSIKGFAGYLQSE